MPLPKCGRCKWEYPESLLTSMFIGSSGRSGYTEPICGICALDLSNEHHGVKRKEFGGEIAEHMRQMALRWRKKNPKRAPSDAAI